MLYLEAIEDGYWLTDLYQSNKRCGLPTLPRKRLDPTMAFGGDRPFVLSQILGDFLGVILVQSWFNAQGSGRPFGCTRLQTNGFMGLSYLLQGQVDRNLQYSRRAQSARVEISDSWTHTSEAVS